MSSQAHDFFFFFFLSMSRIVLLLFVLFVSCFILFRGAVLNVQILLSTVNVNKYTDFKLL